MPLTVTKGGLYCLQPLAAFQCHNQTFLRYLWEQQTTMETSRDRLPPSRRELLKSSGRQNLIFNVLIWWEFDQPIMIKRPDTPHWFVMLGALSLRHTALRCSSTEGAAYEPPFGLFVSLYTTPHYEKCNTEEGAQNLRQRSWRNACLRHHHFVR